MGYINKGEIKAMLEDWHLRVSRIELSPPTMPPAQGAPPERRDRQYTVFQGLATVKQEIQDEFSKRRLSLNNIKRQIEEVVAAVPPVEDAAEPVPAPREDPPETPKTRPIIASRDDAPPERSGPPGAPGGRDRARAVVFAVLVLCAAAFGSFRFYHSTAAGKFPLPSPHVSGLCLDQAGGRVFFSDPQRQLLFEVSAPDGRLKSMQSFPAAGLTGLAFDGALFWSTDGVSVYRHDTAGSYAAQAVHAAEGSSFLSWDGGKIWAAAPGGRLHRYAAGNSLAPDGTYPMPPGRTAGISMDGGTLWLFDPESGKLSGYKLDANPELIKAADLRPWLPKAGTISAFALRNDHIWFVMESPSYLVRLNLKRVRFSEPEKIDRTVR